jgi:acyl-CoA thioesterase FadM
MFRYVFRVTILLVRIWLKPKRLTILDTSIINGRVMLGDVDFNVHLNNGLIQTSMDFGRYDLLIRAGILQFVIKEKWRPIAGSTLIAFRKSLPLFAAYAIHSRIIGWDDKWVYFEQKIVYQGKIAVHAFIRALMRGPKGNIPPSEIALKLGVNPESPALPQMVTEWQKADALMLQKG